MGFDGEYGPSTWEWVADQAAEYEASNGQQANTLRDTGLPIIVMTTIGHKTGLVRKVPLMKVEHEGIYAIVASKGGAVNHPGWYHNLLADPTVLIQDGPEPFETTVRLANGGEPRRMVGPFCSGIFAVRGIPRKNRPRNPPVFN